MKTKLLKVIRANFKISHVVYEDYFWFGKRFVRSGWISIDKTPTKRKAITSDNSFDLIVKMLECIYPQGRHYAIMRHSRRFKQARREKTMRILEIASVLLIALVIIAILVLNTCCGSGIQY